MSTQQAQWPDPPQHEDGEPVQYQFREIDDDGNETDRRIISWEEVLEQFKIDLGDKLAETVAHTSASQPDLEYHFTNSKNKIVPCKPCGTPVDEWVDPTKHTHAVSNTLAEASGGFHRRFERMGTRHFSNHNRRKIKASKTAIEMGMWGLNKGKRLNQDEDYKRFGLKDEDLADIHTACFEPEVELAEVPLDRAKSEWISQLLQTPEFASLRAQTVLDVLLSDIASINVSEQYVEYRKAHGEEGGSEMDKMRSASKAAKQAKQDCGDAQSIANSFGLELGKTTNKDPKEMLELFREVRENRDLKRICDLAGRYRRLAQAKQRVKDHYGLDEVVGAELGGDLSLLLGSELSQMGIEELEWDLLRRLADKQALIREHSGYKKVAKGPIIVLLDESGSMSGEPICQAKALALALAWIAKSQGRWAALVSWSGPSQYNCLALPPGQWDPAEVTKWCCQFIGGGTHPPIEHIQQIYDTTDAPIGKTDMIWISDGYAHVDEASALMFNQWRHEHKARSIGLLVQSADEAFELICDTVHVIEHVDVEQEGVAEVLGI